MKIGKVGWLAHPVPEHENKSGYVTGGPVHGFSFSCTNKWVSDFVCRPQVGEFDFLLG